MPKWIKGTDLTPRQVELAKSAFTHRSTEENRARYNGRCPSCVNAARGGRIISGKGKTIKEWTVAEWHAYHSPLMTDAEWLKAYQFQFSNDGEKMGPAGYCEPVYLGNPSAA